MRVPIEWLLTAPTSEHVLMRPLQAEIHCEKARRREGQDAKRWLVVVCFWSHRSRTDHEHVTNRTKITLDMSAYKSDNKIKIGII